jgi:hypothetical protein
LKESLKNPKPDLIIRKIQTLKRTTTRHNVSQKINLKNNTAETKKEAIKYLSKNSIQKFFLIY